MKSVLAALFVLLIYEARAQPNAQYFATIEHANAHFRKGDFDSASYYFLTAFQVSGNQGMRNDRYHAAQAFAMSGRIDSAIVQLQKLTRADWQKYDELINDSLLLKLHDDKRWPAICQKIKENAGLDESKLNFYAKKILDTVLADDQSGRLLFDSVIKNYGKGSKQFKLLVADVTRKDSINVRKVCAIIDSFGWLGKAEVGMDGNMALFLVIQHAPLKVQEKYMPVMKKASEAGNLNRSYYAMLEDRVLLGQGKEQVYGSQVSTVGDESYVAPLTDPVNVDKRRRSVGLPPIARYLKDFDIVWDVDKYIANLPRYREMESRIEKQ